MVDIFVNIFVNEFVRWLCMMGGWMNRFFEIDFGPIKVLSSCLELLKDLSAPPLGPNGVGFWDKRNSEKKNIFFAFLSSQIKTRGQARPSFLLAQHDRCSSWPIMTVVPLDPSWLLSLLAHHDCSSSWPIKTVVPLDPSSQFFLLSP